MYSSSAYDVITYFYNRIAKVKLICSDGSSVVHASPTKGAITHNQADKNYYFLVSGTANTQSIRNKTITTVDFLSSTDAGVFRQTGLNYKVAKNNTSYEFVMNCSYSILNP